ncbi:hypothetical protein [Streptomyces litchfieldiae]|uniref:Uncharacterized protein n=1 Tax=Streptomyces litchfieldiae TaxID=3075543 RepID=A0ABU2N1Z6_9ACTN|nr:hypothetical protein [Streptomyces sp. DSM 44938]MDT0347776.1 hypothetical protein [Streptomyces sp. DSM 44938]
MLAKGEIDQIKTACDELGSKRVIALSVAAGSRVLPAYQAYSEARRQVRGHGLVHDGMVGIWRVLRARPRASAAEIAPLIVEAIRRAEADFKLINETEEQTLPEELAAQSITAATHALRAYLEEPRMNAFHTLAVALEIDVVWAESEADGPNLEGVVSRSHLLAHYGQQMRDAAALAAVEEAEEKRLFRDIAMRAEREGLPYLLRMRDLVPPAAG